jgi:hypothetical protein
MEMPSKWIGNGWYRVEETSSLSFTDRLAINGKVIESSRELIIKAWSVPAAETAGYGELVGKIHQNLLNILARERFGRIRPPGMNPVLAGVLAFAAYAVVMVFLFVLFGFLGSLTSNVRESGKAGLRPADSLDRTRAIPFPPLPFPGEGKPGTPFPTPFPPR